MSLIQKAKVWADPSAQTRAVLALREMGEGALIDELKNENNPPRLRRSIALALGSVSADMAPAACDVLIKQLGDPEVAEASERALLQLGELAAPRLLLHLYSQEEEKVKDILVRLGHKALPTLIVAVAYGDAAALDLIAQIYARTGEKTALSALRTFRDEVPDELACARRRRRI